MCIAEEIWHSLLRRQGARLGIDGYNFALCLQLSRGETRVITARGIARKEINGLRRPRTCSVGEGK